jgi:hypothetical protein
LSLEENKRLNKGSKAVVSAWGEAVTDPVGGVKQFISEY